MSRQCLTANKYALPEMRDMNEIEVGDMRNGSDDMLEDSLFETLSIDNVTPCLAQPFSQHFERFGGSPTLKELLGEQVTPPHRSMNFLGKASSALYQQHQGSSSLTL